MQVVGRKKAVIGELRRKEAVWAVEVVVVS